MLLFKNGRFHGKDWSFVFPDGCYLDTDPPSAYSCGVSVMNAEQDIRFGIFEDKREPNMPEQMRRYLFGENDAYEQDSPIAETELNGLSGFDVFYHGRNPCYEVWLSLPDNRMLTFFAEYTANPTVNVKEHPFVKSFLSDIRKEK